MNHQEVMRVLTTCQELSDLPLRHNEDVMNAEYASMVADSLVDVGMFSNHLVGLQSLGFDGILDQASTKARLLLVGHFARVQPPIVDYITDLKSVMEQTGRVLQALIDIAAEAGTMSTVQSCIELSQMIYQGRFHSEQSPLQSLASGWNRQCDAAVASSGVKRIADAIARQKDMVRILTAGGVAHNIAQAASRATEGIPDLSVGAELSADNSSVVVTLRNDSGRRGGMAHTSASNVRRRPDGWFVLVSKTNDDSLLALKRVDQVTGDARTRTLRLGLRVSCGIEQPASYTVTVMNDAFIGIDTRILVDASQ
jgi:activating signal cointegrator complex subunit 3